MRKEITLMRLEIPAPEFELHQPVTLCPRNISTAVTRRLYDPESRRWNYQDRHDTREAAEAAVLKRKHSGDRARYSIAYRPSDAA